MEKKVRVRFNGGREGNKQNKRKYNSQIPMFGFKFTKSFFFVLVVGKLMGYDPLLNLVLDETIEYLKGLSNSHSLYI